MTDTPGQRSPRRNPNPIPPELCKRILETASRGMPRLDFLQDVSSMLREFSGCDSVEIRIVERDRVWICKTSIDAHGLPRREVVSGRRDENGCTIPILDKESDLERLLEHVALGRPDPSVPFIAGSDGSWLSDTGPPPTGPSDTTGDSLANIFAPYESMVSIAFAIDDGDTGLLVMWSLQRDPFTVEGVEPYRWVAKILGIALAQRRVQLALRERIKEMTCLYGIAKAAGRAGASIRELVAESAELLRRACLYESMAATRIEVDEYGYSTEGFRETPYMLTSDIVIEGRKRGTISLVYIEETPELDEGPFLAEERKLIDAVAGELALVVDARRVQEERKVLREQLRHADRLATIGQLAAGIAHELNEPLTSILGRAQLTLRNTVLPEEARRDSEKIATAALRARDIISKLRLFARHAPPEMKRVDLNAIVRDGLDLVESRCAKAGIALIKELEPDLPPTVADPGQLYQVLINLAVNAMQATPDGGRITVRTKRWEDAVGFSVQDTGIGMSEETMRHIFTPFFTTKELDEGTGLGLAVVHGIVTSHGGSVTVESEEGEGSCFVVKLPLEAAAEGIESTE